MIEPLIAALGDSKHLIRQQTLVKIREFVNSNTVQWQDWKAGIQQLTGDSLWEPREGGFLAASILVTVSDDEHMIEDLVLLTMEHLEDPESRVRLAVCQLVRELVQKGGLPVFQRVRDQLFTSIALNFQRGEQSKVVAKAMGNALLSGEDIEEEDKETPIDPRAKSYTGSYAAEDCSQAGESATPENSVPSEYDCTDRDSRHRVKATSLVHDTEGWHALETSVKCLQLVVASLGPQFSSQATPGLLRLLYRASVHTNRFVRESSQYTFAALCEACDSSTLLSFADDMTLSIAQGMSDGWSQVRYAASVAVRQFLLKMGAAGQAFHSRLLPRLCLNRHFSAEGVKMYSQDTWKLVFPQGGKHAIAEVMEDVVGFLISQALVDNHVVREAACQCIAELCRNLDPEVVSLHVTPFLNALMAALNDESWAVRDVACLACADLVAKYYTLCGNRLPDLFPHFYKALVDSVWSVRETAAIALGTVVRVHCEVLDEVLEKARHLLGRHRAQPSDIPVHGADAHLKAVHDQREDAKRKRDNDPELHQNQQLYSCGSIAPKHRSGDCCPGLAARASQPWEETDGALYLLRELSETAPDAAADMIPMIGDIALDDHFLQYYCMWQTVWQVVPILMQRVGKKQFKRHMDTLLPGLEKALQDDHPLASTAAKDAARAMQSFVGPSIFRGHCSASLQSLLSP